MRDSNESSRVFVANLPPSLNSDQLRQHFAARFSVTDAHVLEGRRIGFVGLKDVDAAQAASKYFNKTFIRMSKISVDIANAVEVKHVAGERSVPQSTQETRGKKRKRYEEHQTEISRRQGAGRDVVVDVNRTEENKSPVRTATADSAQGRSGESVTKNPNHLEVGSQDSIPGNEEVEARSDNDWLHQRKSRLLDLVDPEDFAQNRGGLQVDQEDHVDPDGEVQSSTQRLTEPTETRDGSHQNVPNARLFVRNLPFEIAEDQLQDIFSAFGKVEDIHLVRDSRTLAGKGLAFVQYIEPEHAEEALHKLDGQVFQGRLLHILPSTEKKTTKLNDFEISKLPLKKQKEIRRKAESPAASFSWNSLYMNPDAVIASVAQRLGVNKSEVLDPTSSDAAVKQAHAETSIIAETKDYLVANGVNIDSFKTRRRDDRSLLLKNFPFGTSAADLSDMLEKFGSIQRFVFPPSGTMAIVEYTEPGATTQALKQLAYRNINGVPLYLEKAPSDLFKVADADGKEHMPVSAASDDTAQDHDRLTYSVFVKNLSFSTTTARLTEVFKPLAGFLSARVKTKKDAKRPNEILSMGFGFAEFRTTSEANAAVAAMNGHHLDGHQIQVQVTRKSLDAGEERKHEDKVKREMTGKTRVILKNLPFQTTKKDVQKLLTEYGKVRTIRVPKKFDNTARGFAFADFVSAKEAESAIEALSNTHLLGRRLVLEFAEEDTIDPEEQIRAIERKVGQQTSMVQLSKLKGSGRRKFNVDVQDGDQI